MLNVRAFCVRAGAWLPTCYASVATGGLPELRQSEKGTVAITFSLVLAVLTSVAGGAVDMGRWLHAHNQSQNAIDAAVLAAGRALQTTSGDARAAAAAATAFYNQMKSQLIYDDTIAFVLSNSKTTVEVTGNARIATPFMGLLGVDSLPVFNTSASSHATSTISVGSNSGTSIELSMMLDLTGSMCEGKPMPCSASTKLTAVKDAAKDLIDIVVWNDQSAYTSKVALVPYSMGVNAGTYALATRGKFTANCSLYGCSQYKFKNAYGNSKTFNVSNCVSERVGSNAYTDASPASAPVGLNYTAPLNPCLSSTVFPLSSDKVALRGQIDAMQAAGTSAGHVGIAWGWYTLSPNWATVWPSWSRPEFYSQTKALNSYGQPKLKKIAILMTDGEYNTAYCNGIISQDSTYGSGDPLDHINCNAPNGSSYTQSLALCSSMKAANVEIFTVGFQVVDNQRARDVISKCATDSSHSYVADSADALKATFRDIALKVSVLRLTH